MHLAKSFCTAWKKSDYRVLNTTEMLWCFVWLAGIGNEKEIHVGFRLQNTTKFWFLKPDFWNWNICSSNNKAPGSLLCLFLLPLSFTGCPGLEIRSSSPWSDLPVVISGGISDRFSSHLYPCVTDVAEQHSVENAPTLAYQYNAMGWWCLWAWSLFYRKGSNSKRQRRWR